MMTMRILRLTLRCSSKIQIQDEEDVEEKRQCLRDEYQDDEGEEYEPPDEDSMDVPVDVDDEEDDEMAAELERQMSNEEEDGD